MEIVQYPNEILVQKCPDYDTSKHAEDVVSAGLMKDIMLSRGNCAGLAAPQVGIARRFFVMREGISMHRYCFDPKITGHGRDLEMKSEGCMSLGFGDRARGGTFLQVPRWRVVSVEYLDEKKRLIKCTFKGLDARVFQHECDHLNGLLIIKTENDNVDV